MSVASEAGSADRSGVTIDYAAKASKTVTGPVSSLLGGFGAILGHGSVGVRHEMDLSRGRAGSVPASAQSIYKCRDAKGGAVYQSEPCPEAEKRL